MTDNRPRILCVDDEIHVLDGIKLNLRKQFDVHTATSGDEAVDLLVSAGPFAVIISDLRMPGMTGVEVLALAARRAPLTQRLMLTGQADLPAAMAAINDGRVSRLLLKPCPPQALAQAIAEAAETYRVRQEERVLTHGMLQGTIQALTGTLALSRPAALNRARRIRELAGEAAGLLRLPERSAIELAATLSQLGAVALPADTARRLYEGGELGPTEQDAADRVALVTARIIAGLPRTDEIRHILETLHLPPGGAGPDQPAPTLGARLLKICIDYDVLTVSGLTPPEALAEMGRRSGTYDPDLLARFADIRQSEIDQRQITTVFVGQLQPGMILGEELRMRSGHVLAPRGARITEDLIAQFGPLLGRDEGAPVKILGRPGASARGDD